jgi:hypothetical protein
MTDIIDAVNNVIENRLLKSGEFAQGGDFVPGSWNLDSRAMPAVFWFNDDYFVVRGSTRQLDYYGGFEYVDRDYKKVFGDYTFYSTEDDRVRDLVDSLIEGKEQEEAEVE